MNLEDLSILMIEDDADDALIIRNQLAQLIPEKQITWFSQIEQARVAIKQYNYDIIFLDFRLGHENGLDILAEIRRIDIGTPVIMLTGMDEDDLDIVALQSGAADFLSKEEITPRSLRRTIRRSLARDHRPAIEANPVKHFDALYGHGSNPSALLAKDGKVLAINAAMRAFCNLEEEAEPPENLNNFPQLSPDNSDTLLKELIDAACMGQSRRIARTVMVAEQPRSAEVNISPIVGEDGVVRRLILEIQISRNPSSEIGPEQSLMWQEFIENVPAAVAMFDTEMRYVLVSTRWLEDYQLEGQPIIGKSHYEIFPEIAKMQHWLDVHQRALRGEILNHDRDAFVRADGSEQWIRWQVRPWHTNAGEVGGIVMFTEEITEAVLRKRDYDALHQTQQALGEERSRLKSVMNSMSDLMVFTDHSGRIRLCNESAANFAGKPMDAMIGREYFHITALQELFGRPEPVDFSALPDHTLRTYATISDGGDQESTYETVTTPVMDTPSRSPGVLRISRNISQQERLKKRIIEQEKQLELALEASEIGVFTYSEDGRQLNWDARHYELHHQDPNEFTPDLDSLLQLILPEDRGRVAATLKESLEHDDQVELDYRIRNPDGSLRYLESRGRKESKDGRILGTTRDVTISRRAALQIQRAKERMDVAIKAGGFGIMEWARYHLGTKFRWDIKTFELLGINPNRHRASLKTFMSLVAKQDRRILKNELRLAQELRHSYRFSLRINRPDGQERVLELRGHFESDNSGRLERQIGTIVDITQRKVLEHALESSQQRLELALRSAGLGTWMWRFKENRIHLDATQARILGLPTQATELPLYSAFSALERDSRSELIGVLERKRIDLSDVATEALVPQPDGSNRIVELNGRIVTDEGSSPTMMIGIGRDVTVQRTQRAELEKAKDAAESAAVAKSRFLANMSHEIRTPINAIMGFAQLLHRSPELPEALRDQVDTIKRSGGHLLQLVNDILEISKIEAGMVSLNFTDFELKSMLNDLERMFALRVREIPVEIHLDIEDADILIKADEGKLRQILINLLNNAVKFTNEGEITLAARLNQQGSGPLELFLAVTDTGIGIDDEDQKKIFEEFQQAKYTNIATEGTGLGLSICSQFVELMGGSIEVASKIGQGSTFSLRIPVQAATSLGIESSKHGHVIKLAEDQGSPRVLVIDDKADNRKLLVELLSIVGFETQEATGFREALFGVREWEADLVLMDIHMPKVNGYQIVSRIRSLQEETHVPVIAMSASVAESTRKNALEAGADYFLRKPFSEDQLFEALEDIGGFRFEYSRAEEPTQDRSDDDDMGEGSLVIPEQVKQPILVAAQDADFDTLLELAAKVEETDKASGKALARLVNQFDYKSIIEITESP